MSRRTRIPGVFDVPPPPPGFDPRTATAEEFRRTGMRWRRSLANRNPILRGLWERATARRYAPAVETDSTRHMPLRARRLKGSPDDDDYNWAGPIIGTGNWTGVIGSWVVPTLSQPAQPPTTLNYSNGEHFTGWWLSTWVGLDGYLGVGSNDCLQIGVTQQIDTENKQYAWAWYEWWLADASNELIQNYSYINPITITGLDVSPGDTIMATVAYVGSMAGQVSLFNLGKETGNYVESPANYIHKVLAPPTGANFNGRSAEWIAECPGGGESGLFGQPPLSLAAFTPINFTGAVACNCASDLSNMIFADPSSASAIVENIQTAGTPPVPLTSTTVGHGTATITFIGG